MLHHLNPSLPPLPTGRRLNKREGSPLFGKEGFGEIFTTTCLFNYGFLSKFDPCLKPLAFETTEDSASPYLIRMSEESEWGVLCIYKKFGQYFNW